MINIDNIYKTGVVAASLLLSAGVISAQELQERLEVEGVYSQDKLPAYRLEKLPEFMRFNAAESRLQYASKGVTADFSPSAPDAAATVWGAKRDAFNPRGYIDLSLGSYLNSSLSAGYKILREERQTFGVRLQHNSTSLWRPYSAESPKRFSYQDRIGLDYSYIFPNKGILSADIQYRLGYFNYYGGDPVIREMISPRPSGDEITIKDKAPTQTLNDVAFKLGWEADGNEVHNYSIAFGGRYFAYRTATREMDLQLTGGYAYSWSRSSMLGVDVSGDMLLYSSAEGMPVVSDYGAVTLTPYYNWERGNMLLRIGADIDMAFNADGATAGEKYGAFHIAPDLKFDVTGKNVGFYVHLLGGTRLHTLAYTSDLDPYRNPQLFSTRPVYTPIDANIGLNLFPFSGFKAAVNLQYRVSKNIWAGGWYNSVLDYGHLPIPGIEIPQNAIAEYGDGYQRYNLAGLGVGVDISYSLRDILRISAGGTYTPQRSKTGIFNGLDRPRWVVNASIAVKPVNPLELKVEYNYRGVRRIYATWISTADTGLHPAGAEAAAAPEVEVSSLRMADINNLRFKATWKFNQHFSINFQADNLINKKIEYLPGLPLEGIVLAGGVQWLF